MGPYLTIVLCVLLTAGCTLEPASKAPGTKSLSTPRQAFSPLTPDIQTSVWQQYQDRAQAAPKALPKLQLKITKALTELHRAEVRGTAVDPTGVSALQWRYVQRTSPATYAQLGRHIGLRMIVALQRLLSEPGDPLKRLHSDPVHPSVQAYLDLGGVFIKHAAQAGILSDGLTSTHARAFAQALFMRRWIEAVPGRADAWSYLTAEEHRWYLRYLVEGQHSAPLDRRLEALGQLAALPNYPVEMNRALIYAGAGQFQKAIVALEGAQTKDAKALRRRIRENKTP